MKEYYTVNNEELIETKKEEGKVKAYVHGGMYTMDGTFHIIDRDKNPAIFANEQSFMASLHKEHPYHQAFNGNIA